MTADHRIRLLYVIAYQQRWPLAESLCRLIDRTRFDVTFILLHAAVSPLVPHLEAAGIPHLSIRFAGKRHLPRAIHAIFAYCRARAIDVVHTHFMNACLAGLIAARLARVPVRIHTRHHAGPLPWSHREPWGELYDRWNNRLSTRIIAPCQQAREALVFRDGVAPRKVRVIHHGVAPEAFDDVSPERVTALRAKYQLNGEGPVIGVAARFERIKGVHYIIAAFGDLLADFPEARLVLANARGGYSRQIKRMLAKLPADRICEIAFEDDIHAFYRLCDLFVHTPIGPRMEGFGQVFVEPLMARVPAIFTRSGVAAEFPDEPPVARFVPFRDSAQIHAAMKSLLTDERARQMLIRNGRRLVDDHFAIAPMVRHMERVYQICATGVMP